MKPRPITKLHESLERRLTKYALAASATGIGLLASSQPAAAKIVYTKADKVLTPRTPPMTIDLNHDGIDDFTVYMGVGNYGSFGISVIGEQTNEVAGYLRQQDLGWASALRPGVRVGPNQRFSPYYNLMAGGSCNYGGTSCNGFGPWAEVQNRYLGFKFSIKGKVHYGWARLSVNTTGDLSAVLTGYAYENVPNKPILTGKTEGPEEGSVDEARPATLNEPTLQPAASLGLLAMGAPGVSVWRREESVGAVP
jgi:hypothetical protein